MRKKVTDKGMLDFLERKKCLVIYTPQQGWFLIDGFNPQTAAYAEIRYAISAAIISERGAKK